MTLSLSFPASFPDEGVFFLARLIGWEGGTGQGVSELSFAALAGSRGG